MPALTQDDLLALADRILPQWYLEPLRNPGPGYELLQAFAQAFARCSTAAASAEREAFVITATSGAKALCTVEFYRTSVASGAFTVKRGTVARSPRSGRRFQTLTDVAFGALDLTKQAVVEAVWFGAEYNEPGPRVTLDGTALPGEISDLPLPLLSPLLAEPALQVRQLVDAVGGSCGALDQHGDDRGIDRLHGEDDGRYRGRVGELPDTVTPAALRRQLDAVFLPRGLTYDLIETWENHYQSCWDNPDTAPPVDPVFGVLHAWGYDDPRTDPFAGRWLGIEDERGAFVVVVPEVGPIEQRGGAWDDPTTAASGFAYPSGRRATTAWDVPLDTDSASVFLWVLDGDDSPRNAFYRDLYALLRSIKGGGVWHTIELRGE